MKRISLYGMIAGLVLGLCACAKTDDQDADARVEKESFGNSGYTAILETENGYYYNLGYSDSSDELWAKKYNMMLRYYDKNTRTNVMLCNKPECDHTDPETCVAIYKNLIVLNTQLYDGALYIYGVEHDGVIVRFALYKAALDGSSIDRVGVVFEAENTIREEEEILPENFQLGEKFDDYMCCVIYKGEAYLPYRLQIGQASRGFQGGGVVRMNLKDGSTEQIFSTENKQGEIPYDLRVCGDYLYFKTDSYISGGRVYRYSVSQHAMAPIPVNYTEEEREVMKKWGIDPDAPRYLPYDLVTQDKAYRILQSRDKETRTLTVSLSVTSAEDMTELERIDLPIAPEGAMYLAYQTLMYEDLILIRTQTGMLYIISVAEDETHGKLLAVIEPPTDPYGEHYSDRLINCTYKVKDNVLYFSARVPNDEVSQGKNGGFYLPYTIYTCPLDKAINGETVWEEVFTFEECR